MNTNEAPVTPGLPGFWVVDHRDPTVFHPLDENGVPTDGYVIVRAGDAPAPTPAKSKSPFAAPDLE